MPKLVKLYIKHVLIGFGVAAVFVAGLLFLNVANLWHLVSHSDMGWLAVVMLVMFNGVVFSGVQFGLVIMSMAEDSGPKGGKREPMKRYEACTVAVPVPAQEKVQRRR